jgi:hypothetical protein
MSYQTWQQALKYAMDYSEEFLSLGGGEPTLHPMFWQILGEAIANINEVWLATNGSITNTAVALAKMAKKGVICCALSLDSYHDPIDPSVIAAFTKQRRSEGHYLSEVNDDYREIRNVTGNERRGGRCDWGIEACVCPDIIIMPDGTLKACGCDDAPTFGTVFDPQVPRGWEIDCCHSEFNEPLTLPIEEEVCI